MNSRVIFDEYLFRLIKNNENEKISKFICNYNSSCWLY